MIQIPTQQATVAGLHILVQSFADRLLLVVSHNCKIGQVFRVNPPFEHLISSSIDHISATRLLGSSPSEEHETLSNLYALKLASIVFSSTRDSRPVLLCLSLDPHDNDTQGTIRDVVKYFEQTFPRAEEFETI